MKMLLTVKMLLEVYLWVNGYECPECVLKLLRLTLMCLTERPINFQASRLQCRRLKAQTGTLPERPGEPFIVPLVGFALLLPIEAPLKHLVLHSAQSLTLGAARQGHPRCRRTIAWLHDPFSLQKKPWHDQADLISQWHSQRTWGGVALLGPSKLRKPPLYSQAIQEDSHWEEQGI